MSDAVATLLGAGSVVILALAGAVYRLGLAIGKLSTGLDDISGRLGRLEDWRSAVRHGAVTVVNCPLQDKQQ
jgi:hypothetical protein